MSLIYTTCGHLRTYTGRQKHRIPFVRKMLNLSDKGAKTELVIAKKLLLNPQNNVVNVLKVSEHTKAPYIDYQRLDTVKNFNTKFKYIQRDVRNGLKNLHKLNIIYIDLKDDNIAYDTKAKQWKIIDFDMSGICSASKLKWRRKPLMYWKYNSVEKFCKTNPRKHYTKKFYSEVHRLCKKSSLVRMDEIIYYVMFGEKL